MSCGCGDKKSAPAAVAPVMVQTSAIGGLARVQLGTAVPRIAYSPSYSQGIVDMDGTPLPDPDPNGPAVREPVDSSTTSTAADDTPGAINLDGSEVDGHTSPLGQALEALGRIFTGDAS